MGSIDGQYVAAIFGVTGLVGKELTRIMTSSSEPESSRWKRVYGIARRPESSAVESRSSAKFEFIQCDLQNRKEVLEKLSQRLEHVTHVFWVTWANQACPEQNKAMLSNALDAVVPRATALKHFSLQTGLKHYVSLIEPFTDGTYDEDCPRVLSSAGNFYYDLEDLVKSRLSREANKRAITWSIHRPGLLLGSSSKAHYNFVGSLAVYGTLCRNLNLPFIFGGSRRCWDEFFLDGSDARLVAAQHVWASDATSSSLEGQAFNAVNGDGYTWREIWPELAAEFGVGEAVFSEDFLFGEAMGEMGRVWDEIVEREGLVRTKIEDLANWEFLDMVFRCPMKLLGRREKADRLGFTVRYDTLDSILYWFRCMRSDKLIP